MRTLAWRLCVLVALLLAARLCQAACIPEGAPRQLNQDALARLLAVQGQCPLTALDFRNLVEGSGARVETTMVNFFGFDNPDPGGFFLFAIVSGPLAGVNLSIERGDLVFGHFLTAEDSRLVLATDGLLVEAIAWDPAKHLFNFYELTSNSGMPSQTTWFYRGDSGLILDDIQFLCRQRTADQPVFRAQLRCSGCHVNGGLIQKELASPHNDWWTKSRPLPLGSFTPDATVMNIFHGLADADALAKLVQAAPRRLAASPEYQKALRSRSMQEQLRPLFCAVEVNIESDPNPFDERQPVVHIPSGFFADPRLGVKSIEIPRENYNQAIERFRSHLPDPSIRVDADHAWLTPVKANSDMVITTALKEIGEVDDELVTAVLAVDFTNPLFSAPRCGLLKLAPAEGGRDFLLRFDAALRASSDPAAKLLLENLTDPKRNAEFHRRQVSEYLNSCQERASKPEAATQWFGLLAQRRADVDEQELSRHPQGHILESGRVVFPLASVPSGRLELTSDCEVRPR
jgi:hypothetical protein